MEGQGDDHRLDTEAAFYDQEQPTAKDEWSRYDRGNGDRSPHRRSRTRSRSPRVRSGDRRDDRGRRSQDRERDGRRHYSRDRDSYRGRDRQSRNFASRECRVYVTNIPYELKWQELKDIMRKAGDVQYVDMVSDNQGQPRGTAVVEFTRAEDAATAIKDLDDLEVLGRKLKIREDRVDDDKYQRQLKQHKENEHNRKQHSQMSSLMGGGNMSFLNSKNTDPVNCTVFVSNLDYKTTWQKVKDVFRRAGHVVRVEIAEDSEKKSKGFGTVIFETPGEALQAVSMFNGFVFGERSIVARLDRDSTLSKMMGPGGSSNQGSLPMGGGAGAQSSSAQQQNNPLALLQLQSLAALSALASGAFGNLGSLGGSGSGLSNNAATGLGNQTGLDALGGLGALQGLGGLSNLLGGLSGNLGGALGQGSSFGGGMSGSSSLGGGGGGIGNMGNSQKIGSGSNRDDSGKQIFIRNLPWKVTWQDLKDRFRNCGHIVRADVMTDDRGRSKGCGTILFEHADEANIAVSLMNGTKIDGRDIEVRIDRK